MSDQHRVLRSVSTGLLITIGSVGLLAYTIVHWAERQILTPDNWVALVRPLPKQPVVSKALGSYVADQVFVAQSVQQKVSDALPSKASFLASPLTDQLNNLVTKAAQRLVASDAFQTIWTTANKVAITRLVSEARGRPPPNQEKVAQKFNLNLSNVSGPLRSALGSAGNAIPALQPASQKAIAIAADLRTSTERTGQYIRSTDYLAGVLPLFIVASLLWALALSKQRRRTTMTIAVVITAFMLLELIGLKAVQSAVLDEVKNPGNIPAITYIYGVLVGLLRHMIAVVIGIAILVFTICVLAGPYNWATSFRSYTHLSEIKQSQPMIWWRTVRRWVGRYKYYLWIAVTIIVLAIMALFVSVSSQAALNGALALLSLFALIQIIGAPPRVQSIRVK